MYIIKTGAQYLTIDGPSSSQRDAVRFTDDQANAIRSSLSIMSRPFSLARLVPKIDQPHVFVIKIEESDQTSWYYTGSDSADSSMQSRAYRFVDRSDAQDTIDRELSNVTNVRIVRVNLRSDVR